MDFFRTIAHVDLEALYSNLMFIKNTAKSSKILALVKSDAYGHGAVEVSKFLSTKVDALGVANVCEALELYRANIQARILIFGGFLQDEELVSISDCNLEIVVHNFEQLDLLEKVKLRKPVSVWLKIDTGMNRLGFYPQDAIVANQRLLENKQVKKPLHYITHFSDADSNDGKTVEQIDLFKKVTTNWDGDKGLANSAAIFNWSQSHNDWVRPGIFLYGISSIPGVCSEQMGLFPVLTLTSKIITIKKVKRGDAVGYGSTWVCQKDTLMGVIAIGYGDGYPWHIKPGTMVLVHGRYCLVIGRVSMDYITIDITDVANAKVGDLVILWGKGLPVENIAYQAGTSPYELGCQLTKRVKFKYYNISNELDKVINNFD